MRDEDSLVSPKRGVRLVCRLSSVAGLIAGVSKGILAAEAGAETYEIRSLECSDAF